MSEMEKYGTAREAMAALGVSAEEVIGVKVAWFLRKRDSFSEDEIITATAPDQIENTLETMVGLNIDDDNEARSFFLETLDELRTLQK